MAAFHFSGTDLPILQSVYELEAATIEQVAALVGRSYKRTADRMVAHENNSYLRSVTRRPLKKLYALGSEGKKALIREGYAPSEIEEKRFRLTELKPLGINHKILLHDIHTKLILLTRYTGLTLVWDESPSLSDSVTTKDNRRIPVEPDAKFAIESDKWRCHFFTEADVGTMRHEKMRQKIEGYVEYFRQQLHIKKYPTMKVFRVATITRTRGRAEELQESYRRMLPANWLGAYPVLAYEDLTLHRLMPELAQSANT